MQVKSHIQMPKSMLKQFEDINHFLYFYDCSQGIIKKGHAKTLNTKEGYFSCEIENILCKEIEHPFSKVLDFLKGINWENPEFTISNDFRQKIKKYVSALMLRSEMALDSAKESSIVMEHLEETMQHDWMVVFGLAIAEENHLLDDYEVTVMVNKSQEPFVLPLMGMFEYRMDGIDCINIPITPWMAITYIQKEYIWKFIKNEKMNCLLLDTEQKARKINKFACIQEMKGNKRGVVSSKKGQLERILKEI